MEVVEEIDRLKEDIKRHLDNEMELLRRAAELRTIMTEEQREELLRAAMEHPHAKAARELLSDPRNVEAFLKVFSVERDRAEAPEEDAPGRGHS